MNRTNAVVILKVLSQIEKALDTCPHKVALQIERHLEVVRRVVDREFPGGCTSRCTRCEQPLSLEDNFGDGDEWLCEACYKQQIEQIRACRHTFGQDQDESGNPILVCDKCGLVEPPRPRLVSG